MRVKNPSKDARVRSFPTQSRRVTLVIDLVDQRQVFVAFGVLDFIHADRPDRRQGAMRQPPADHILDGVAHRVPRRVKRFSGFFPGELPGPAGQKQHIGAGQRVLAIAPRHRLDHHPTRPARDAPHAVPQEHQKAPKRNELEAPLGQLIVARGRLVAPRADRRRAGPRPHVHVNVFVVGAEAGVVVDEAPMVMAVI